MFALKHLSHESVAGALARVERYRLLNEPAAAESICRDILEIEPNNQPALIQLSLCSSDQIAQDSQAFNHAVAAAEQLRDPYERAYYTGIAWERRAKARFHGGGHGSQQYAYDWTVQALKFFEQAEEMRPPGNDDAILRWNTCVRFLHRHPELAPAAQEQAEPILSE